MTDDEKPLSPTAQDDIDESDWDEVDGDGDGDDEKTPLLSSPDSEPSGSSRSTSPEPNADSRFSPPPPSPLKRISLLTFIVLLLFVGFHMRGDLLEAKRKPKIIHASRYSKDYKFRPAASPIITETLKDGRLRLRGALPTPTATTTPAVAKKKKVGVGKATGKRKAGKSKRKQGAGFGKRM
ncbi:hypothetical protein M413DRAFT_448032 [Hebeloma cylindrosporum]|uniref:Uncharacterized protein n=1 Tax=Hebeloma cylindrosporum TaxID=76867 RepID=A0A0C3BMS2_HEBCY|nr:hypothetical protein M413DRAFT_448032 [Hebeloma cylindrosporum h7]